MRRELRAGLSHQICIIYIQYNMDTLYNVHYVSYVYALCIVFKMKYLYACRHYRFILFTYNAMSIHYTMYNNIHTYSSKLNTCMHIYPLSPDLYYLHLNTHAFALYNTYAYSFK